MLPYYACAYAATPLNWRYCTQFFNNIMGVLKKVITLSCLVLLAALVWQWTRSVDIQGKKVHEP